jgi:hypothetical protein
MIVYRRGCFDKYTRMESKMDLLSFYVYRTRHSLPHQFLFLSFGLQTNIANAHLTLAENLCLIGDRIDASIRHGASLATRLRQEAGRDLALVLNR